MNTFGYLWIPVNYLYSEFSSTNVTCSICTCTHLPHHSPHMHTPPTSLPSHAHTSYITPLTCTHLPHHSPHMHTPPTSLPSHAHTSHITLLTCTPSHIPPHHMQTDVVDDIATVKFVYIQWVGESVKTMTRAKISTHKGDLEAEFKVSCNIEQLVCM